MDECEDIPLVSEKALEYRVKHKPFCEEEVSLIREWVTYSGKLFKENGRFGIKGKDGCIYIREGDVLSLSVHYRPNGKDVIRYREYEFKKSKWYK